MNEAIFRVLRQLAGARATFAGPSKRCAERGATLLETVLLYSCIGIIVAAGAIRLLPERASETFCEASVELAGGRYDTDMFFYVDEEGRPVCWYIRDDATSELFWGMDL